MDREWDADDASPVLGRLVMNRQRRRRHRRRQHRRRRGGGCFSYEYFSYCVHRISTTAVIAWAVAVGEVLVEVSAMPPVDDYCGNASLRSASASSVALHVGVDGSTTTMPAAASFRNLSEGDGDNDDDATLPFRCGIYMATSTIPGAGFGVFSGVDRTVGDVVGSGDAIIPIVDVRYHLRNYPGYYNSHANYEHVDDDGAGGVRPTVEFTVDYVWNGMDMGMARESAFGSRGAEGVTAYCPGLDAAINCHLAIVNVDKGYPQYDALQMHRSKDPGAGAFSPYHNCTTVATSSIPAGAELFKYYGENWFLTRQETFPNVPLNDNYDAADHLIREMDELLESLHLPNETEASSPASPTPAAIGEDLYRILTSSPYQLTSRTLTALPRPHHLASARQSGVRSTNLVGATKSLHELQTNGLCVDTIVPGKSTISQAGRGAFARTSFRAAQVVTGSPLLVCDSVEFMTLYDGDWWERSVPPTQRKVGNQIVLNYCHQHPSSPSLFLCPYGYLVNYINHAPTTQSPGNEGCDASSNATSATYIAPSTLPTANVKLVWAHDGAMGHNASLLESLPRNMMRASPGLFWHYVATRDIREGDEILLDYGDLWQQAWDQHVHDFEQKHRHRYDPNYRNAREYNYEHVNATLRTVKEQVRSPYPGHLELRCLNELGANGTRVLSTLSSDEAHELWTPDNVGSRCLVIGRDWHHDRYLYRVELEYQMWDSNAKSYRYDSTRIVKRVERAALRFFDVPYSTDLFLPTAFRHPMGIPDHMFPAAWRNYHGYHHHQQQRRRRHHSSTDQGGPVTAAAAGEASNDSTFWETVDTVLTSAADNDAVGQASISSPETVLL